MQGYILNLLILVSISAILSTSLNFIIGYAGIYSMAHAAFFGVAAYAGALVAMHVSTSLLVTMKGLAMTYNRDMQEDKEPLFTAADQLRGSLEMARVVIQTTKLNAGRPQAAAEESWVVATDLAEALARAGTPFHQAHQIVGRLVLESVREGKGLASSLEKTGVFPELSVEMIEVGESTGALPAMLNSVAEFFEEDVQTQLAAIMSLIEPVILIGMGLVVVTILIALYMPIFSLGNIGG